MKKTFISFLIMTLIATGTTALVNAPSVHAATTDESTAVTTSDDGTIKVTLENIRELMLENNLDIKIKYNQVKIARETYDDAKTTYEDATEPVKPNRTDYSDDASYQAAMDEYDAEEETYESYKTKYETALSDLQDVRDTQEKEIETQIYAAQEAYITYLYDLDSEKLNEDTVNQNRNKQDVYKLQYDSGFISKNAYLDYIQGDTSSNDLSSSKNTSDLDKAKLLNLLGIGSEEKLTLETDLSKDFEVISKINYDDDLSTMLQNNITIQSDNDDIDDADDAYDDDSSDANEYKLDSAKMQLTQDMNTAETDFKAQYNTLMSSYNSIKSQYDVVKQTQNEYEATQTAYDYGYKSKSDLDAAKLSLDNDNATFIKARNACYLAYLKYIEMKEGY